VVDTTEEHRAVGWAGGERRDLTEPSFSASRRQWPSASAYRFYRPAGFVMYTTALLERRALPLPPVQECDR